MGAILTQHERADIIDRANARRPVAVAPNGDTMPVTIHGYRLAYPFAQTPWGQFELSWGLAQRLADGTTTRVRL